MATRRVEIGPTGDTVRENIATVRREQQLTLRELSDRLATNGRPLAHNTLSEIERGARRVDVDDLMAIAVALDVSPMALLMPDVRDEREEVSITGAKPIAAKDVSSFIEGYRSLSDGGLDFVIRSQERTGRIGSIRRSSKADIEYEVTIRTDGKTVKWASETGILKPFG
ncbi:helix-turn-helix domain-containing protein [Rhodococcus sp. EPR-157]|uniref:helix-turn-helix domain-containing protein n=1 Tax=Rhodococcus sp. EPR-157 TaxID=1813677 RepID=UPI0008392629|nr:helix-turn-helix transcriptional regulator [Rhodococcus sp. EPR-157]